MDIKVNVREAQGDTYVVDLSGEIDVYTSPKVKDAIGELIDQAHYNLVINLEKVRYIDSTGLGVLIGGLKRVREHGGSVNLVCTNPQIKKIFDITGLVKIFGIFDDERCRDEGARVNQPLADADGSLGIVELRIPRKAEWVAVARLAVAAVANRLRFSIEEIEDVKLAVAEACTNCHPARRHGERSIEITCEARAGRAARTRARSRRHGTRPETIAARTCRRSRASAAWACF